MSRQINNRNICLKYTNMTYTGNSDLFSLKSKGVNVKQLAVNSKNNIKSISNPYYRQNMFNVSKKSCGCGG
tara:strand:+ start:56 stop:268 length:213 start_codon:yes stop_codon:yes gene_type:complete